MTGLAVGIGFIATAFGASYAMEGRSLKLYLVNAGYPIVALAINGVILALWK